MSHIFGCKQTPPTPPTTSDEESSGNSSDAEMKKKKGNRAVGKKKYPKAIKYYTKAIKVDPENPTYRLNRAIANAALELWKNAEDDAADAVELGDPPSSKSHFQLARARLRRGQCIEAKAALEVGLQQCPGESALVRLGKEIEKACKNLEARQRREEELKAKPRVEGPDGARALLDQARALYEAGQIEPAAALLRDAHAAKPTDGAGATEESHARTDMSVLSLLGKASMQLRRWEDAAAAFRSVIELEEAHFSMENKEEREALSNAYNNLGIACKNQGQMGEAIKALNASYGRATNGDDKVATPQAAQILQNLAQCLRAEKKLAEAEGIYVRALDVGQRLFGLHHSSNALNHVCIARCCRDTGRIKESIESYTKALEIWEQKDIETCLAEMPEVPSKERFQQVQQQARAELTQIILQVEQARQGAAAGSAE
eukprot:CAMPEP_0179270448 /NCGR_PEP_ID=MMETSP0797-20121207/31473_1 /TAXON_ID=47934 /ORGANISM="Dinophysis acuminata, Strain DAEP01" /LENGTH=430 /DNA_ID=CAMNT_0020978785 /DNA_START=38 /DNA_END=1328 /DNA_ORIENTATION=-